MARKRRSDHEGAHLLVTNRGTAQTALFRSNSDRRCFLAMLGDLDVAFGVEVLAYVLMGNHYHLVLRLRQNRLAEAMQNLDGNYARRFNAVHGRSGALFQGRYDARLLDTEAGLQGAGYYLRLNPFRAGLVREPASYPWSSLPDYIRGRSALRWLRLDLLDGRTGGEYRDAIVHEAAEGLGRLGAAEDDQALFADWDRNQTLMRTFSEIDRAVAARFGVSVDELYVVSRGRLNIPRMIAIATALRGFGVPAQAVASRYGLRHRTAVYAAERRLEAVGSQALVRDVMTDLRAA